MADESTATPATITANDSMHGWIRASAGGIITESAEFEVDSTGNVAIISGTANVVANAACADNKICLGTGAAENPLVIKQRFTGTQNVVIEYWYH